MYIPASSKYLKVLYGAHIYGPKTAAMHRARELGFDTVQIFLGGPQRMFVRDIREDIKTAIKELIAEKNICVIAHAPYAMNIFSKDADIRSSSWSAIMHHSSVCSEMNIGIAVMHENRTMDREKRIHTVKAFAIAYTEHELKRKPGERVILAFENQNDKIDELYELVMEAKDELERVGLPSSYITTCADITHVYMYTRPAKSWEEFTGNLFPVLLKMAENGALNVIHVSDTAHPMGSNKHRHTFIGEGTIGMENIYSVLKWTKKLRKVKAIYKDVPLSKTISVILEHPSNTLRTFESDDAFSIILKSGIRHR
ncbi:hypothetical protein DRJ17_05120 [Candidatus Woesearchaeota archaeon]|mgnify:CR=1 FL=1|nr:MAG: hypothetical protein DRJ17_05120 [Candidatus Woesearchaeota archaeon]